MARKGAKIVEAPGEGASVPSLDRLVRGDADALRKMLRNNLGAAAVPEPEAISHVETRSTGLQSLDLALGIGGYPKGRMSYIAGPKHSGKTALALLGVAAEQLADPEAILAIVDIEHAYSESLASVCGVDISPERFIVIRPESAEQACDAALNLMGFTSKDKGRTWQRESQSVNGIIYDSWAGSPTENVGLAELARVGAARMPHLSMSISRANCLFWMINQIRLKPGVMFGNPEYEPGGEALKHAYSIHLQVHKIGEVEKDSAGIQIGHTMKIFIAKNKCGPGYRTVHANLNYFSGFDRVKDAFAACAQLGVDFKESPGGNILVFASDNHGDPIAVRANGEKAFLESLRLDVGAQEALYAFTRGLIAQNG